MKKTNNNKALTGERLVKHDQEMMEHLWKRTLWMDGREYYFFKSVSRVPTWYKKPLSDAQRSAFMGIWDKYKGKEEKYLKKGERFNPETRKVEKK